MSKKRNKRECNICGEIKLLTDDHVPPKACGNIGRKKHFPVFEQYIENKTVRKIKSPFISQNGKYFSSICSSCNNGLLGLEYDPSLVEFTQKIKEEINDKTNTTSFQISTKLNRVTRAIAGHLLAAFGEYNKNGFCEIALRKYFLDKSVIKINDFHLYFFIYPFDSLMIARNFAIFGKSPFHNAIISVIKFPPISLILSDKPIDDNMIDLFEYTTENIDEEIKIDIDTQTIFHSSGELKKEDWPLTVSDDYIFLTSENTRQSSVIEQKS